MNAKKLESQLGSREVKGAVFSDDGTIRRIPRGFAEGWQNANGMRKNTFPIALTGDEDSPEKLAEIMEITEKKGCVWVIDKATSSRSRLNSWALVTGLREQESGLCLNGDKEDWTGSDMYGLSFGIHR